MSANLWRSLRNVLASCLPVERSQIAWGVAFRTFVTIVVVLVLVAHSDNLELGLPFAMAVFLTNLSDMSEPPWLRWRTMLAMALACALATLLGGLVSQSPLAHLVTAFVVAAAVGFAGALGLAGGLVGVVCLALFSLHAGSEISSGTALMNAAAMAAGGCLAVVLAMFDAPRNFKATRRKVGIACRKFAEVCAQPLAGWSGTGSASAILDASRAVDISGAAGPTLAWFRQLLACLEHSRLVVFALVPRRGHLADPAALDRLLASASGLTRGIADALVHPRRVSELPALLSAVHVACELHAEPADAALVARLRGALDDATQLLIAPWPIGAAASCAPVAASGPGWFERLRQHGHSGDVFIRHARQMSLTYGLATAISLGPWAGFFINHAFWIPLTVAWICKPDLAGTVSKVSMRVTGTVLGGLLAVAVLSAVPLTDAAILFLGLGAFVSCAFMWANYTVVVAAVTVLVLAFGELSGFSVEPLAGVRILATFMGAGLVMLTSLVQPLRSGVAVPAQLARLCADARRYASALQARAPDAELVPLRRALLQDRTALSVSVAAAASEPAGLWEKDRVEVDVALARTLLDTLEATLSGLLVVDLLGDRPGEHAPPWEQVDASITGVENRLPQVGRPAPGKV